MTNWRDLVALGYESVGNPDHWREFLVPFDQHVGGDRSCFAITDVVRREFRLGASSVHDPGWIQRYADYYCWRSPLDEPLSKKGIGWSGVLDLPAEAYRSEFYTDYMAPVDLHHLMMGHIGTQESSIIAIATLRSKRREAFGRGNASRFRRMVAQLQWAFALQAKLDPSARSDAGAWQAWDAAPQAAIMLDVRGRIAYLNPAALRLLEAHCGLAAVGNRLMATRSEEQVALQRLISEALQLGKNTAQSGGTLHLRSRDDGVVTAIEVHPINLIKQDLATGGKRLAVALFLTRSGVPSPAQLAGDKADQYLTQVLCAQFAFTYAEVRLALALAECHDLKLAAEALGITYNTARTRLQVLYSKTGTHRQSALVTCILSAKPALMN